MEIFHTFLISCFIYRESRTKQFLNFSKDKDTLTYNQSRVFHFDESASVAGLKESDIICTINIPFVVSCG